MYTLAQIIKFSLAGVLGIFLAILTFRHFQTLTPSISAPAELGHAIPRPVPVDPSPVKNGSSAPLEKSVFFNMSHDFYTTKNMRSFIEAAKLKPQEGGMRRAARGLLECEERMKWTEKQIQIPNQDAQLYARQLDTLKHAQYLCQGMLAKEVSFSPFYAMTTLAKEKGDVISLAWGELNTNIAFNNANTEASRQSIAKLLNLQESNLLEEFGPSVMLNQSNKPKIYWFDGQYYEGAAKTEMRDAWSLVPCDFGMQCDKYELMIASICIEQAKCYDSRFDQLQHGNYRDNPEGYQRVLDNYHRVSSAIQQRNLNAFIRNN